MAVSQDGDTARHVRTVLAGVEAADDWRSRTTATGDRE